MKGPRTVIIWTPSYACKPFKVVFDSDKCDAKLNPAGMDQICKFYDKKGEDPEVRMFHVGPKYPNKKILEFFDYTMEIATSEMMKKYNKLYHKNKKTKPLK